MNRTEKVIELKKHILGLDEEETRYRAGQTYSDVVVDGESLCRCMTDYNRKLYRMDFV